MLALLHGGSIIRRPWGSQGHEYGRGGWQLVPLALPSNQARQYLRVRSFFPTEPSTTRAVRTRFSFPTD